LHNQGLRFLVLFDEASAIPDVIRETAEAALPNKDTEIICAVFGNPSREQRAVSRVLWSLPASMAAVADRRPNREDGEQGPARLWSKDYGENCDFVRVPV
jgi:hypothetical protein